MTTRIVDVIKPYEFTEYQTVNSMVTTTLFKSGVLVKNGEIRSQLAAGAESFSIPFWGDLGEGDPDLANDNPAILSVAGKLVAARQVVRKAFLHASWSAMSLASELSGDNAVDHIKARVSAYWDRAIQRRLVASLQGVIARNIASEGSDMVLDVSGALNSNVSATTRLSVANVVGAVASLGDQFEQVTAIAMSASVYRRALIDNMIATVQPSTGEPIKTFQGLAVIISDSLPFTAAGGLLSTDTARKDTVALMGMGAIAYAVTAPRVAPGTEIENLPSAGRGGGQEVLHTRINAAVHPMGYTFVDGSVADVSPSVAELRLAANWTRVYERRAVPLAFLVVNS